MSEHKNALPTGVPKNKLVAPGTEAASTSKEDLPYPFLLLKMTIPLMVWEAVEEHLPVKSVEKAMAQFTLDQAKSYFDLYVTVHFTELLEQMKKKSGEFDYSKKWEELKTAGKAKAMEFYQMASDGVTEHLMSNDKFKAGWVKFDEACRTGSTKVWEQATVLFQNVLERMNLLLAEAKEKWPKYAEMSKDGVTQVSEQVSTYGKTAYDTLSKKSKDLKQANAWNDAMTWSAFVVAGVSGYWSNVTAKLTPTEPTA